MPFPSNPFSKPDSVAKTAKKVLDKDTEEKKVVGSPKKGEPVDLEPKLDESMYDKSDEIEKEYKDGKFPKPVKIKKNEKTGSWEKVKESTDLEEAFHHPLAAVLTAKGFKHEGSSEEDFRKAHLYSHPDGHTAKVYPANRGKVASVVVKHKDGKTTDAFNVDQLKRGVSSIKESVDLEEAKADISSLYASGHMISHKGEDYIKTGKTGTHKASGEETHEYEAIDSDKRFWKTKSGKIHEGVEEIEERTLTDAELKKREEVAKAIERENPGIDKSKKMAIATATAKKVTEESDLNEASIESLEKTYQALSDRLGMAREKRRAKGQKGVQGDAEMKIQRKMNDISAQITELKKKSV